MLSLYGRKAVLGVAPVLKQRSTLTVPFPAGRATTPPSAWSLFSRNALNANASSQSKRLIYSTRFRNSSLEKGSSAVAASLENVAANRPIAYWLFGCAGLVGTMIMVGGATRLTRSGLSMVTWKPHGGLPPMTQKEWEEEFELYKKFPEWQQRKNMTVEDFKGIYAWEYGHRMLGRLVGVAYGVPLAYFLIRKRVPRQIYGHLAALFALGAAQGGVGWWMVRSGLQDETALKQRNEVRVSPYRLATHLTFAFFTMGMLLWTGMGLLKAPSSVALTRQMISPDVLNETARIRKLFHTVASVFGYTVISGAFVAGIDAGMAYNTFPKMGDDWIPDGLFELKPYYRNFFENTPLVQLDHRMLAMSTIAGYAALYGMARRPHVWKQLPQDAKTSMHITMGVVSGQVMLGILTLLNCVPIPLAIAHQGGAIAVMTSTLYSMHTLNFSRPLAKVMQHVPK